VIAGQYIGLLSIGILLLVLIVWLVNRLLARDVRRRKQEAQLSLLQTITMEVAAEDLSSALAVVLRRVCEKTGWDFGQWLPRRGENLLELGPVWMGDSEAMEKSHLASKEISFQRGEGLPGRVWRSKHSAWLEDVTRDPNFPRARIATECGLKAALAIPILVKDDVIAVIEFFLREPRPEISDWQR
jgi:GAF domain-containing protein